MTPLAAFAAFALLAPIAAWALVRRLHADPTAVVLGTFLAAWTLLPVGPFPPGSIEAEFPYWLTGGGVPSDMGLTKAWVAPTVALLVSALVAPRAFAALRPTAFDAAILLWCAWPLASAALADAPRPSGPVASLHLLGTWGSTWLLGRLHLASAAGRRTLVEALPWAGLALLPIALWEGVLGPAEHGLYGAVFDTVHPFRTDGADRYLGFRPLGFFENGNQYGIWLAVCTLAAVWLAIATRTAWRVVLAGVLAAMAVLSQAVGALLLLGGGLAVLASARFVRPRVLALATVAAVALGGTLYASGAVDWLRLGKETAFGRATVDVLRHAGRGSLPWRVAQDQRALHLAVQKPIAGTARWDWWRPLATRPWALAMQVLGQFGAVGLFSLLAAWLGPAVRAAWRAPPRVDAWDAATPTLALAAIACIGLADAALNAFVAWPSVLAAAALAGRPRDGAAATIRP